MIDPWVAAACLASGTTAGAGFVILRLRDALRASRREAVQRTSEAAASAVGREKAEEGARHAVTWLEAAQAVTQHLVEVRLPALVDAEARGYRGVTVPGLSIDQFQGQPIGAYHQAVLHLVSEAVSITRDNIGLAARSSVRDIIAEAQTFLVRCQMKVYEEIDRYPEGTAYHQSLYGFDHLVTQSLHTLQRTLILTGSWPGLQRADDTFSRIVVSALGRIDAYLRVDYNHEPGTGAVWVEGRVVEPVTVALTELLANATAYSDGKVIVEVQQTQTGYCIVVDDGGLNMNSFQRQEAARLLSQQSVLDVTTLPDTLHLGFPVIGRLSGEYGFQVDVSTTSPFGGVRAVLRIPRDLLGQGPSQERHALHRTTEDSPAPAATAPLPPEDASAPEAGTPVLPQRRRHQPKAPPTAAPVSEPAPEEDPDTFAQGIAGLAAGIREGETEPTEGEQPRD